ncbi:MAG: glycosyltransferase family 9 protein [bacterium]
MQRIKIAPKSILVLRLSSFGDIVLTEPTVRSLKMSFPDAKLHFLTLKQFSELPAMFTGVDNVIGIDKQTWFSDISAIMSTDFDLAVDLHNTMRTRAVLRRIKPARIIHYRRARFKRFLCVYMPFLWRGRLAHTVDLYAEPLERIGISVDDRIPKIEPPSDGNGTIRRSSGEITIGICPGASSPYKRWSESKYAELAKRFLSMGYRIFLIGWKTDKDQIEKCKELIETDVPALIGQSLKEVAVALSSCKVAIGNDSGLMHFAQALGVKVAVIFGPSSPLLGFGPVAPWSLGIYKEIACSPCSYHGNVPCKYGHYNCLELISARDVATQVAEILMET